MVVIIIVAPPIQDRVVRSQGSQRTGSTVSIAQLRLWSSGVAARNVLHSRVVVRNSAPKPSKQSLRSLHNGS